MNGRQIKSEIPDKMSANPGEHSEVSQMEADRMNLPQFGSSKTESLDENAAKIPGDVTIKTEPLYDCESVYIPQVASSDKETRQYAVGTDGTRARKEDMMAEGPVPVAMFRILRLPENKRETESAIESTSASESTVCVGTTLQMDCKPMIDRPFNCRVCPYSTSRKIDLDTHERAHTGKAVYKCSMCEYTTNRLELLNRHQRRHTAKKQHKCSFCSYCSRVRASVVTHERTHTGEKPYKCSFCPFSACTKVTVSTHERIHTGVKPYKCSFCYYKFSQKGHLDQHERIHTGEKPYKCSFCSYSASRKGYVNIHERTHSGEKA